MRTFSITESEEHGPLPTPTVERPRRVGRRPVWIIAGVLLIIAAANGYWPFQHEQRRIRHERRGTTEQVTAAASNAAIDGIYSGPICYAAAANDPARWFRAQATVGDGKISGRWPAREPGVTMIMTGAVAGSGAVQIEMHTENAEGARLHTIELAGDLRDGKLEATGGFVGGRKVDLTWQRQ